MFGSVSTPGWTLVATALVLTLGQLFESTTHAIKTAIPKAYLPVVDAVLAELTTLGFMGLMVSALEMGSDESLVGRFSDVFLGEPGELFRLFKTVDQSLSPITVAFIGACTVIVAIVLQQFQAFKASTQAELLQAKVADDAEREACEVGSSGSSACAVARSRSQKAHGLLLRSMSATPPKTLRSSGLFVPLGDMLLTVQQRRAEFLRFRARFIEQARTNGIALAEDFQFGKYLALSAAQDLKELLSIQPVELAKVWLPLMLCELALLTATGGLEGDFLPSLFGLAQVPISIWAVWNFARLSNIKQALAPQLGVLRDPRQDGRRDDTPIFKLLPPKYSFLRGSFNKPTAFDFLNVLERPFAQPALSAHDELFGPLGSGGPAFYLASMKVRVLLEPRRTAMQAPCLRGSRSHSRAFCCSPRAPQLVLFSAIVSLAFFGGGGGAGMVDGLASTLAQHLLGTEGDGSSAFAESISAAMTVVAMLPSLCAVLLTPFAFVSFIWVTSVEGRRRADILELVLHDQRMERFHTTLASLAALCDWVDQSLDDYSCSTALSLPRRTRADVEAAWEALLVSTPPERLLDVRALFEAQDVDASGAIGIDEVHQIIRHLGYEPSAASLAALFQRMDVDGSGEIDYIEFVTAIIQPRADAQRHHHPKGKMAADSARPNDAIVQHGRLFDFFDSDRSGTIDESEMLSKLEQLGFDGRGVTHLFADLTGGSERRVTRATFERYVSKII